MTTDQQPPPSEGPANYGNGNGVVIRLEVTEEIQKEQLVTTGLYNFKSKSVTFLLNHKYQDKLIDLPINLDEEDGWVQANKEFHNILRTNGVTTDDSIKIEDMFNLNSGRIKDHHYQQTIERTKAGQLTKKQRIEGTKNAPPREVSVSQALMMHDGNVRIKGMFVGGSAKVEKMYNQLGFRCGDCDHINILADYRDTRPRLASEIPSIFGPRHLSKLKCQEGCESSIAHEPYDDLVSALRVELHDTETSNDPKSIYVILFNDCTSNPSYLEQVIITGSIQRVRVKDKVLPHIFVGLDTPTINGTNPIEYVNKRESVELTQDDEKTIQEFVNRNKDRVLDALAELVAPSHIGHEDAKKGLLMCAANSGIDSVKRKRRINILFIGETGLGKSALAMEAARLDAGSKIASATDSTISSLIAVIDKDTGFFRFGPVLMANGAICVVDEMGRMPLEDQGRLLSAMQEGTINFGRYGLTRPLEASASFVLTANPNSNLGKFRDGVKNGGKIDPNEFPFLGPFKDRIDLIFVFTTNRDPKYARDYASDKSEIMDDYYALMKKEGENYQYLRKHILYCKKFDPTFSSEVSEPEHMIKEFFTSIVSAPDSQASYRVLDTLRNLCYSVARLKLKDTIDSEDVKEVMKFYNKQLKYFSEVANVPSDPRDSAHELIKKKLTGGKFSNKFMELLQAVCNDDDYVSQYIGFDKEGERDWNVRTNIKVRQIRDKFTKEPRDERILILGISPLTLAWRETYVGGDKEVAIDINTIDDYDESDASDKSDTDYAGRPNHNRSQVYEKSIMSKIAYITSSSEQGFTTSTSIPTYDESDKSDASDIDGKRSEEKFEGSPDNSSNTNSEISNKGVMSDITHITRITLPSEQESTRGTSEIDPGIGGNDNKGNDEKWQDTNQSKPKPQILEGSNNNITSDNNSQGRPIEDYKNYVARQKAMYDTIESPEQKAWRIFGELEDAGRLRQPFTEAAVSQEKFQDELVSSGISRIDVSRIISNMRLEEVYIDEEGKGWTYRRKCDI